MIWMWNIWCFDHLDDLEVLKSWKPPPCNRPFAPRKNKSQIILWIPSIFAGGFSCEFLGDTGFASYTGWLFNPVLSRFVNLSIGSSPYPLGPNGIFDGSLQALGYLMTATASRLWGSWSWYPPKTRPIFAPVTSTFFSDQSEGFELWTPCFHTRLGAVHLSRNMSAFGWEIFPSENIWTTIESTN